MEECHLVAGAEGLSNLNFASRLVIIETCIELVMRHLFYYISKIPSYFSPVSQIILKSILKSTILRHTYIIAESFRNVDCKHTSKRDRLGQWP